MWTLSSSGVAAATSHRRSDNDVGTESELNRRNALPGVDVSPLIIDVRTTAVVSKYNRVEYKLGFGN